MKNTLNDAMKHPSASRVGPGTGLLIMSADDWGQDSQTTNKILECGAQGAVSSVSAMVFMPDSETSCGSCP